MRKSIIVAFVSIIAVVIVYKLIHKPPQEPIWRNNIISAGFDDFAIDEKIGEMPATAELHIDASGSMKPYFKADGLSLINTLSEIVNLNQSGTSIYFLDNKNTYKGLIRDILGDINKQPNSSNTLFHDFLERAACKIDSTNTIIYLVTDGIMSIHDTSKDMSTALVELRGKIENSLKEHTNLAGAIYRYVGGYKGRYWNSRSIAIPLNEQIDRPYYIIALGRKETMRWLESIPATKLNNPERLFMGIHDLKGHKKATLALGENAKIEDIHKEVTLFLDLPECLRNIDVTNAVLTNRDDKLDVGVANEGSRLIAVVPPTIPLRPEDDGKIKIELNIPNIVPDRWIGEWNSNDDTDGPDSMTTFGLGTLVTGMFYGLEKDSNFLSVTFTYKR